MAEKMAEEVDDTILAAEVVEIKAEDYKAMQQQISELTEQVAIAQAVALKEKRRAEEIDNFVKRLQADFDNYKRRTNESAKHLKEDGIVAVIEKIVPALDVIQKALSMIADAKIADGVKMIYRQLSDMLIGFGVTEIPSLGEQFDPNFHNAISTVAADKVKKANTIVEVYQSGYQLGDRVIRHSSVIVAN